MAQPTEYNRQYSFQNFQASSPSDPLPGVKVDLELNTVKQTLDEVLANLALIQNDDGTLGNETVGRNQLDSSITLGFAAPTVWATSTAYTTQDTVFKDGSFYSCIVAHTSGTFATDLAAEKWLLIADFTAINISDLGVTTDKLAAGAVTTSKIADLNVTTGKLADNAVTLAKMATQAANTVLANITGSAAVPTAVTKTDFKTWLAYGALAALDTVDTAQIDADAITSTEIAAGAVDQTALATDAVITAKITDEAVTLAKMQQMAASTFMARKTASTGAPEHATAAEAAALLPAVVGDSGSGGTKGLVPAPAAGDAAANKVLAASGLWTALPATTIYTGHLFGCTLSNNGTDATNDIDIAAGLCADYTGAAIITCAALTKRLDADWSAGTGNGMRYSGAAIANTTYHIFAAAKADGTQDYYAYPGADEATALTALQAETGGSAYAYIRRIGAIIRASGAILAFTQIGDRFELSTPVLDINTSSLSTSSVTYALASVPAGIVVEAILNIRGSAASAGGLHMRSLTAADVAPSTTVAPLETVFWQGGSSGYVPRVVVVTNTSAQIAARSSANTTTFEAATIGWIDRRGRDA